MNIDGAPWQPHRNALPISTGASMLSRAFPVAVLCAALAAGCASSGTPDPANAASHTVVVADGRMVESVTAASPKQTFAYPADKVWTALNAAYSAIGVDVVLRDNASHRIGNPNFYRSGQTNGEAVSHFANCGNGMTPRISRPMSRRSAGWNRHRRCRTVCRASNGNRRNCARPR